LPHGELTHRTVSEISQADHLERTRAVIFRSASETTYEPEHFADRCIRCEIRVLGHVRECGTGGDLVLPQVVTVDAHGAGRRLLYT
jgi:hypothetical protein